MRLWLHPVIDGQTETRHVFASKDTTRGMPTGTILGIVVHLHWPGLKSFSDLNLETAMRLTSPEISEYDTRRVTRKKKVIFPCINGMMAHKQGLLSGLVFHCSGGRGGIIRACIANWQQLTLVRGGARIWSSRYL